MESYHVEPYDFDGGSDSENDIPEEGSPEGGSPEKDLPEVDTSDTTKIYNQIINFKKNLYKLFVEDDTQHKAETIGALALYTSIFLECIALFIRALDELNIKVINTPEAINNNKDILSEFNSILKNIHAMKSSPDNIPLLYDTLGNMVVMPLTDMSLKKYV